MLCLLSLLDFRQRLFDGAVRFVLEFWITNQPLIQCFFRPEEVDDPSTTAREEDGGRGLGGDQFCFVEDEMDAR